LVEDALSEPLLIRIVFLRFIERNF
jgi:hypothetical protein